VVLVWSWGESFRHASSQTLSTLTRLEAISLPLLSWRPSRSIEWLLYWLALWVPPKPVAIVDSVWDGSFGLNKNRVFNLNIISVSGRSLVALTVTWTKLDRFSLLRLGVLVHSILKQTLVVNFRILLAHYVVYVQVVVDTR
jgi:hypothetical protein